MRRTSILRLTTLLLSLAVGAWACCTDVPVGNGLPQSGPGVGAGQVCPGTFCGCFASGSAYTPTLPSGGDTAGDLHAKGLYDVFFKSDSALGSMEIAYGCATVTAGCPRYFTPFTQSGQPTPGPSSWLLVSAAAIGILLSRFRITRKKKN